MLTIVGELINTSRTEVDEAVAARDEAKIRQLARAQEDAGATYIDVNCGSRLEDEAETMAWLVPIVQDEVSIPLCIDSPDGEVLKVGLAAYDNLRGPAMVNSISGEDGRYESIFPVVQEYGANVVLLCMDSSGMPETADDRMKVVDTLYARLKADRFEDDRMYFDAVVKPVGASITAGVEVLETNRRIHENYPDVHQILGLSNISYGLPHRGRLNRVFILQTMAMGVDGYIINPTLKQTMADIITSQTLLGLDKSCKRYLKANKNGMFD
ncbi:MAG: dihydropteroate synthase [Eggerthellaceae bacterium]|nr:dihydropteroate synthase [Eggerthellaceae bacterium]